jgi:hypothetical protein
VLLVGAVPVNLRWGDGELVPNSKKFGLLLLFLFHGENNRKSGKLQRTGQNIIKRGYLVVWGRRKGEAKKVGSRVG